MRIRAFCAALASLALLAACTDGGPSVTGPTPGASAPSGSAGTRTAGSVTAGDTTMFPASLCTEAGFNDRSRLCEHEPPDRSTPKLNCAFLIKAPGGGQLHAKWYLDDRLMLEVKSSLPPQSDQDAQPLHAEIAMGRLLMPGGTWKCVVTGPDGVQQTATAKIKGPTGRVSQLSDCAQSDVEKVEVVSHCRTDAGDLPSGTTSFACSALLTGVADQHTEMRLTYRVKDGKKTHSGSDTQTLGRGPTTDNITVGIRRMTPETLGLPPNATMPDGDYACEWLADGAVIATKKFSVGT